MAEELVEIADLRKRLYGSYYGYNVYKVNEFAVRNSSKAHQEFTNYGISSYFPDMIPSTEIWVSEEQDDEELIFSIVNAVRQLKLIARGVPEDKAYESGLRIERSLREKMELVKYNPSEAHRGPRPKDVYVRLYKTVNCKDGKVYVWIVNGDMCRDMFRTDFVEGGHGYVYSWLPLDEVWIDDDVKADEVDLVLYHEFVERGLMRDLKMSYDKAHEIAAEREYQMRKEKFVNRA